MGSEVGIEVGSDEGPEVGSEVGVEIGSDEGSKIGTDVGGLLIGLFEGCCFGDIKIFENKSDKLGWPAEKKS